MKGVAMGAVYGGIPRDLALKIRDACGIDVFVETGTSLGETTVWAAENFGQVVTVEIDPEMFARAGKRLAEYGNIDARLGDSRAILSEVLPGLNGLGPLIWLDAHACGEEDKDSPLLEEIELINRFCPDAAVLIDDARFVLAPFAGRRLCTLDGLVRALDCARFHRYLAILDDVVIAVPVAVKDCVDAYCREATVARWNASQAMLKWKQSPQGRMAMLIRKLLGAPPTDTIEAESGRAHLNRKYINELARRIRLSFDKKGKACG